MRGGEIIAHFDSELELDRSGTHRLPRTTRRVALHSGKGELILDVLDFEIVCIEVLFRDEIRSRLLELMP